MKQKLRYIIVGAIAAALALVWLLLITDDDPAHTGLLFRPRHGEEITQIEIKNSYGDFLFFREGDDWLVSDGGGSYITNTEKMTLLTQSLLNFKVQRVLDSDRPEYGTDKPRAAVEFETSRGRHFVVFVGSACPDSAESYAKAGSVSGTIITDAASVAQLTGSLPAYRTNEVFSVNIAGLESLEYIVGGEKRLEFHLDDEGNWAMGYPFSSGARKLEISEFLAAMSKWRIASYPESFKAAAPERAETLILTDRSGESQTIELGAAEGTQRYARIGGAEDVITLYSADVDLSVLTPEALVYETPLYESVNNVSALYINIGGSTVDVEIDAQASLARVNGKLVDYEAFTSFYYRYVLLLADGWDQNPAPGEAVAQFISTLSDGSTRSLTLYERDEDSLYMDYGAGEGFYLELERLQKLADRLEPLL